MPVVLTFNKISELRPEHRQEVVVIENNWKKNLDALYLREIMAENVWWNTMKIGRLEMRSNSHQMYNLHRIVNSRLSLDLG